jgi:hypothetical protein
MAPLFLFGATRALSSKQPAGGVVGKVVRLVAGGALVQLRGSAERVECPHPPKPAKRLMIHDDVQLSATDGSWTAEAFDDPSSTRGVPRSRAGRSHLDDLMGKR